MSISFQCPQCGKIYKVADEFAGRNAKCACGHIVVVPSRITQDTHPVGQVSASAEPGQYLGTLTQDQSSTSIPQKCSGTRRWYDSKPLAIALLILFLPVGLYALWKNSAYSKKVKIVLATCACLLYAGLCVSLQGPPRAPSYSLQAGATDTSVAKEKQSGSSPERSQAGGVSAITWKDFMYKCGVPAQTSNKVRAEKIFRDKYVGQVVQWQGRVRKVESKTFGGSRVYVAMDPFEVREYSLTPGVDLVLNVPGDIDVTELSKNKLVFFVAKITIQGGPVMPHQLDLIRFDRSAEQAEQRAREAE